MILFTFFYEGIELQTNRRNEETDFSSKMYFDFYNYNKSLCLSSNISILLLLFW